MKKLFILLFALLPLLSEAQFIRGSSMAEPIFTALSGTPTSLSGFSTQLGSQSGSQFYTLLGSALGTNSITVTASTGLLVSKDNITFTSSVTVTPISGSVNQAIWVVVSSSASLGSIIGSVINVCSGVSTVTIGISGTVTNVPAISISGTYTAFSTTAGTASTPPQTVTVSGSSLTADVTVNFPAPMVGSLDNVTYTSTVIIPHSGSTLTGQPVTLYAQVPATASAGPLSGSASFTSPGATTQTLGITGTVSSSGSVSASFNFSKTANPVTGWTNIFGDPSSSVLSATSNTITVSTVNASNWPALSGFGSSYDNLGMPGGTFFPAQVMLDGFFVYSGSSHSADSVTLTLAKNQLLISGLSNANTYTITISGSLNTATHFDGTNYYRLIGATTYILPATAGGLWNVYQNTSNGISFPAIVPDGSGNVKVYLFTEVGQEAALAAGITITKN